MSVLASIVLTCRRGDIVSYVEADELVVFDMDSKDIVARLKKPRDLGLLEDLLEEYDPWVVVTAYVDPEIQEALRDMGFKVEVVKSVKLSEYLNDVFG
jgi:hypothetical protein